MTIQELLLHFQSLSEDDKKAFLAQALATPGGEADTPPAPAPETDGTPSEAVRCPHCHARPRRHGHARNGTQRYFCPNCRRTFCLSTGTVLEHTLKPRSTWELFIRCMVERRTVRDAAETCGICKTTSFLWRHKILDSLQSMMDSVRMDGIVEADETFFRLSYKGNHSGGGFAMPRAAHRRGGDVHTRGLSQEQVCVPTAVTRDGLSVGRVGCLGSASREAVRRVLGGHIGEQATLCTDSHKAYGYLATMLKVRHVAVETGRHMRGGLGIQCVGAYHAHLKSMVEDRFRGVATKYLNNYIVWHNFAGHARESFEEKLAILSRFISGNICRSRCREIPKRNPVPVLV